MCNLYSNRVPASLLFEEFSNLKLPFKWADGAVPNYPPRDEIRIRDSAPIVRQTSEGVEAEVIPWAWPGPTGKPVFNFRSEGRSFAQSRRVLIPADGFYEFTAPSDPKAKRKDKHLFTLDDEPWFWIAGLERDGCFTMLTLPPGPDIAPYHDRQIVVLPREQGPAWLSLSRPQDEVLRTLPAGALTHQQVA
jgi:putative SOS response-associated peptidase YedK